jgi:hypothetical protein
MGRASMRWLILMALLICLSWCLPSPARTRPASRAALDDNYISALAVANRFLHAWQSHDQETVVLLLSNAAKQHCPEDRLDKFFSSDSQAAYEIGRGKKIQPGRFSFPISFFGMHGASFTRPRYTELVVVKTGKTDWAIDRLP